MDLTNPAASTRPHTSFLVNLILHLPPLLAAHVIYLSSAPTRVAFAVSALALCKALFVENATQPTTYKFIPVSLGSGLVRAVLLTALVYFAFSLLVNPFTSGSHQCAQPTGPHRILLIPARTTHTRVFPQRHSFSYPYLVVGVPVGWAGSIGGLVTVDGQRQVRDDDAWTADLLHRGRFHVNASDYLDRGHAHLGLRGKLDQYLRSQGHDPAEYPSAYLMTAARIFGYHFNPVSFWYLYAGDGSLRAMILEVNNTFDERRIYFLTCEHADAPFTQAWPKDFHVSPFSSRKGSYSLIAHDPMLRRAHGQDDRLLDVTITLHSSKQHRKLVAQIQNQGQPLDPAAMTRWQKLMFYLAWSWVGFLTFPRIVKEAGVLFFCKKLHVWFRPEPLRDTLGRHATTDEQEFASVFRSYLRFLVDQQHSDAPIVVVYVAAWQCDTQPEVIRPATVGERTASGMVEEERLEVRILTPAFFSRFVGYAHNLEAFHAEMHESQTVTVSRPDLLARLVLQAKPSEPLAVASGRDFVHFELIRRLRRRPEPIRWPLTSSATPPPPTGERAPDIREFGLSLMDAFVLRHVDVGAHKTYRDAVLRQMLADRVAFGNVDILRVQHVAIQVGAVWVAWRLLDWLIEAVGRVRNPEDVVNASWLYME